MVTRKKSVSLSSDKYKKSLRQSRILKIVDKTLLFSLIKTAFIILFPFINYIEVNHTLITWEKSFYLISQGFLLLFSIACLFAIFFAKLTEISDFNRWLFVFDIMFLFFFMFVPIMNAIRPIFMFLNISRGGTVVYVLIMMASIAISLFLSKYQVIRNFLFSFAIVVVFFTMLKAAWSFTTHYHDQPNAKQDYVGSPLVQDAQHKTKVHKRNVYYIIVDAYSSPKNLKKIFSWNSDSFLREMKLLGFYHAHNAYSSYNVTRLTLGSIFAGGYIRDENSPKFHNSHLHYYRVLHKIEVPPLIKTTQALGYKFYFVGNSWARCERIPIRKKHVSCIPDIYGSKLHLLPYHIYIFLLNTPALLLYEKAISLYYGENEGKKHSPRGRIAIKNDAIGRTLSFLHKQGIPRKPSFLFIHHLSPHAPYLYEANCDLKPFRNIHTETLLANYDHDEIYKKDYIDNVQCTNKRIKELGSFIVKNDPGAIVVIQSDHGDRFGTREHYHHTKLNEWTNESIFATNSILNLLYLPHTCRRWLNSDMNNINTVRLAIACSVSQKPKFIENKSYVEPGDDNPDRGLVRRVYIKPHEK